MSLNHLWDMRVQEGALQDMVAGRTQVVAVTRDRL